MLARAVAPPVRQIVNNEICCAPVPLTPTAHHVMACPVDSHPLGIYPAAAGSSGLSTRTARVGPRVGGAVQDQEPGPRRDHVPVTVNPPRRQRHHCPDVTSTGQLRGNAAAHRMAHQHHVLGCKPLSHIVERRQAVANGIQTRTVPAAPAVLNASHLHVAPQPTPQCPGEEHHPQVGRLPPPGCVVAADLATRQHENTGTRGATMWGHICHSEPRAAADCDVPAFVLRSVGRCRR